MGHLIFFISLFKFERVFGLSTLHGCELFCGMAESWRVMICCRFQSFSARIADQGSMGS